MKIDFTNDTPVDMDNMSLPSFQMLSNKATIFHPAGPTTHTSSSGKASPITQHPLLVTIASEDLTADSTIATCLSALETNWLLILQRLHKLAKMGKLPNPSGSGSTSTPPDSSNPGAAPADPGARV